MVYPLPFRKSHMLKSGIKWIDFSELFFPAENSHVWIILKYNFSSINIFKSKKKKNFFYSPIFKKQRNYLLAVHCQKEEIHPNLVVQNSKKYFLSKLHDNRKKIINQWAWKALKNVKMKRCSNIFSVPRSICQSTICSR